MTLVSTVPNIESHGVQQIQTGQPQVHIGAITRPSYQILLSLSPFVLINNFLNKKFCHSVFGHNTSAKCTFAYEVLALLGLQQIENLKS